MPEEHEVIENISRVICERYEELRQAKNKGLNPEDWHLEGYGSPRRIPAPGYDMVLLYYPHQEWAFAVPMLSGGRDYRLAVGHFEGLKSDRNNGPNPPRLIKPARVELQELINKNWNPNDIWDIAYVKGEVRPHA